MSDYKAEEAVEFVEIYDKLKEQFPAMRAWQVADAVKRTPSYISMILDGKRNPDILVLQELKKFAAEKLGTPADPKSRAAAIVRQTREESQLAAKLREIHQRDPDVYASVRTIIESHHAQVAKKPSSKTTAAAQRLLKRASAPARKSGPK